jgi:hypothetical protein
MKKYFPEATHSDADERAMLDLCRAALTIACCKLDPYINAKEFLRRWGDVEARAVETVIRAAVGPAMTSGSGWAAELTRTSYALLSVLAPSSAGAALLQGATQVDLGGNAQVTLPSFAPGIVSFVGEGSPIPVQKFAASGPSVSPRKLATIVELTNELLNSSNAETLIRAVLIESIGKNLDGILFDASAGDAVRPPGLRFGVSGSTPATVPGSGEKLEAMAADVITLVSAVGAVSGGPVSFIASIPQAVALSVRSFNSLPYRILPSSALAPGMVIAIADATLVSVIDGAPQIDVGRQAELHRETSPQPIATGGTMVTPIGSTFQIDSVALRLRWPLSWCLRAAGVAWMTGVNW